MASLEEKDCDKRYDVSQFVLSILASWLLAGCSGHLSAEFCLVDLN